MYFAKKAKEKRQLKTNIEKQLKSAHKKLAMINLKSDNAIPLIQKVNNKIDNIQSQLERLSLYETQGAILRSKTKWCLDGE